MLLTSAGGHRLFQRRASLAASVRIFYWRCTAIFQPPPSPADSYTCNTLVLLALKLNDLGALAVADLRTLSATSGPVPADVSWSPSPSTWSAPHPCRVRTRGTTPRCPRQPWARGGD